LIINDLRDFIPGWHRADGIDADDLWCP